MNGEELIRLSEIRRVELGPEDVVVVTMPPDAREPDDSEYAYMTERLRHLFGGCNGVVIFPPGWEVSATRHLPQEGAEE